MADAFAYAVWAEGAYLHVLLDPEDLGFNRLVSQLASINDNP
jgi:hypothetical protein